MKDVKFRCDVCKREIKDYLERNDSILWPRVVNSSVEYSRIDMCDSCKNDLLVVIEIEEEQMLIRKKKDNTIDADSYQEHLKALWGNQWSLNHE